MKMKIAHTGIKIENVFRSEAMISGIQLLNFNTFLHKETFTLIIL